MFAPVVVNEVLCVSFVVRVSLSEMNFEFELFFELFVPSSYL